MVAVNHGQRIDPAANCRIGGLGFRLCGAAAVNAEQRGYNMEVVLYPVVHFADQPPLPIERVERFALRAFDPPYRSPERFDKSSISDATPYLLGRSSPPASG